MKTPSLLPDHVWFFAVIFVILKSISWGAVTDIHFSRTVTTVTTGDPMDTQAVDLHVFAEGRYDTIWQEEITVDTVGKPADVLMAFDLSSSMDNESGEPLRWRITWAQISALRFLDSLESSPGSRIAILGWTADGDSTELADTSEAGKYYSHWFEFSTDFTSARAFIMDSLFLDDPDGLDDFDIVEGDTLVRRGEIPGGYFNDTPLNVSTVVSMNYMTAHANPEHNQAVIMLNDGHNDDNISNSDAVTFVGDAYASDSILFYSIGFQGGDSSHLTDLATAAGGQFFYAEDPGELDSVYAAIARQVFTLNVDSNITRSPIVVDPDTVIAPLDIILGFDLSNSMNLTDGTARTRLTWAQIAALNFLDSLEGNPQINVGIFGWTANGDDLNIEDIGNEAKYYQKFFHLSNNIEEAREFVRNELYLDGSKQYDLFNGDTLIWRNAYNGGVMGDTPLNISTMVALQYLAENGDSHNNPVVVMLTDGENDDAVSHTEVLGFIDSMYTQEGVTLYTVGFHGGNEVHLGQMAEAGGGTFYTSSTADELNQNFLKVMQTIVTDVAARQFYLQEVLPAGTEFIPGSDIAYATSTVPLDSFVTLSGPDGSTVLRWYYGVLPIWSVIDVGYHVKIPTGTSLSVLDDQGATNPVYSTLYINNGSVVVQTGGVSTDSILYSGDTGKFRVPGVVMKSLTIDSPNGGENYDPGETIEISWNSTGNISDVKLEYWNGSDWMTIATADNTGSYDFRLPEVTNPAMKIRVSTLGTFIVRDESDNPFGVGTPASALKPDPQTFTLFHNNRALFNSDLPGIHTIQILNIKGQSLTDFPVTAPRIAWNGMDSHGRRVSTGTYLIRVRAKSRVLTKILRIR